MKNHFPTSFLLSACAVVFIALCICGCDREQPIEMVKWSECERMLIIHGHGCVP